MIKTEKKGIERIVKRDSSSKVEALVQILLLQNEDVAIAIVSQ